MMKLSDKNQKICNVKFLKYVWVCTENFHDFNPVILSCLCSSNTKDWGEISIDSVKANCTNTKD